MARSFCVIMVTCRPMPGQDSNSKHVGQVIRDLLKAYRIEGRFDEASIVAGWEQIVGRPVARQTRKIYVRNRVLFVELESAALRHDMTLHKTTILLALQRQFGAEAVQDVVIR